MRSHLTKFALALVIAMALVSGPWPEEIAVASCVAPTLMIDDNDGFEGRPIVPAESTLTVAGEGFASCDDNGTSSGWGCSATHRTASTPMEDIQLRLLQGNREWDLGSADAGSLSAENDRLGQVTWTVTLPDDVKPRKARLETDPSRPLKIEVVISDKG